MSKCVNVVLIPIEVDPQIWKFRVGNQPFKIVERYGYSSTARYKWYIVEPGKLALTDAMLLIRYDGRHCLIKTSREYSVAINGVLHAASEWVTIRDGDTVQVGNWRKGNLCIGQYDKHFYYHLAKFKTTDMLLSELALVTVLECLKYGFGILKRITQPHVHTLQLTKTNDLQGKNTIPVKPVKVCNANRTIRKGIVCTTYEELLNLCCVKFDYKSVNTVVLEEDGTEIDAQYFYLLQENCNLMVLQPRESWTVNDLIGHSSCQAMRNSIDTEKWHPRLLQMPKLEIGLDKNMEVR
ncbi:unnamed protein product [Mytilus edulis]|uniref:CIDE-N domain-containing protein n=1 Tax=Mytilus edulis TaxID=6550 RepID=A0A8S3QDZ0_MYTED|nr:unnamed protein product [Mytilus edulis]